MMMSRVGKIRQPLNLRNANRSQVQRRTFASSARRTVTLIPGDGIGTEISHAVQEIFSSAGAPIDWEVQNVTPETGVSNEVIESINRTRVGLKGPLATPIGKGHRSLNLALRKEFNLYANVRPARTVEGLKNVYSDVDIVTVRENTEGEYSGLELELSQDIAESIKVITWDASLRVANFAFEYARANNRKTVVAAHVAHIMKKSDGLFLRACRQARTAYPDIEYEEKSLANICMGLARNPTKFDVLVLPNLYGDVVSDLGAGLIGGLGLTPSANMGENVAIFEAVHGTAPDIAGQNKANPTALLFSGCMMLRHMGLESYADKIENATRLVLKEGKVLTGDLGGTSSMDEYTSAIIANL